MNEQSFTKARLSKMCVCGETMSAELVIETNTTTTIEALLDAWYEEHPDGDYIHSRFHSDLKTDGQRGR